MNLNISNDICSKTAHEEAKQKNTFQTFVDIFMRICFYNQYLVLCSIQEISVFFFKNSLKRGSGIFEIIIMLILFETEMRIINNGMSFKCNWNIFIVIHVLLKFSVLSMNLPNVSLWEFSYDRFFTVFYELKVIIH